MLRLKLELHHITYYYLEYCTCMDMKYIFYCQTDRYTFAVTFKGMALDDLFFYYLQAKLYSAMGKEVSEIVLCQSTG